MRPDQEVTALRKSGKVDEAYARARELLGVNPQDKYLKQALGWVLYEKVKALRSREDDYKGRLSALGSEVHDILGEYAKLDLERPEMLFSFLVIQVIGFDATFPWLSGFIKWAGGLDAFRAEDLKPSANSRGDEFQALVGRVAIAVAKAAESTDTREDDEFALQFIDSVLDRAEIQDTKWLEYRKAMLLTSLGRGEDAEPILLRFVRDNSRDFFGWHALALVEEERDPRNALALCASAWLRVGKPEFGLKVLADMGRIAAGLEMYDIAKWAVEECIKVRNQKGYGIPGKVQELAGAEWMDEAALDDATASLEELARGATSFVYTDLPFHDATFVEVFEGKEHRRFAKFALRRGDGPATVVFPERDVQAGEALVAGAPVSLKVREHRGRVTLLDLKSRRDGKPFDCLDSIVGVVEHCNKEKGVTAVYVSATNELLLRHDRVPLAESLTEGEFVAVFVMDDRDRQVGAGFLRLESTELIESADIKITDGRFRANPKGFGFVDPDVFVPPTLAGLMGDGEHAAIIAVRKMDKKKGALGWRAVAVLSD